MRFIVLTCFVYTVSCNVLGRNSITFNQLDNQVKNAAISAIGNMLPEFLSSVSSNARYEFINIYSNTTMPRTQIEARLNEWAVQNGVQDKWNAFKTDAENKKQDIFVNVREILKQLPNVFEQVVVADNDKNLSGDEVVSKVVKAFDSVKPYAENIKTSVQDFMKNFGRGERPVNGGTFPSFGNSTGSGVRPVFPGTNTGFPGTNTGFPGTNNGFNGENNGFNGGNSGFNGGNNGFNGGNSGFNGGNNANNGFPNNNNGFPTGNSGMNGNNNNNNNNNNGGFGTQVMPGNGPNPFGGYPVIETRENGNNMNIGGFPTNQNSLNTFNNNRGAGQSNQFQG